MRQRSVQWRWSQDRVHHLATLITCFAVDVMVSAFHSPRARKLEPSRKTPMRVMFLGSDIQVAISFNEENIFSISDGSPTSEVPEPPLPTGLTLIAVPASPVTRAIPHMVPTFSTCTYDPVCG